MFVIKFWNLWNIVLKLSFYQKRKLQQQENKMDNLKTFLKLFEYLSKIAN